MNAHLSQADIAQWNHLTDINDVKPLDDKDRACLDAVRDTLEKFGCLNRFGVSLLHKHFEMSEDEILVEQVDEAARKLLTKPVKIDLVRDAMATAMETQWHWQRDGKGAVALICVSRCFPGNWQSPGHVNQHTGW